MSEGSHFNSCSALPNKQIHVTCTACKTQKSHHHSSMHGKHDVSKLENNPVYQNLCRSLKQCIELVINRKWTMSDVAPKMKMLLHDCTELAHDHLIMPDKLTPYHLISRSPGDLQPLLELTIKELGRSLLNAKDDNECTALMYAVRNANIKCVKCLIAIGADVNLINDKPSVRHMITKLTGPLIDSINLLHPRSRHSYNTIVGIFDVLLKSGADVNKPCVLKNRTPIMYAADLGNVNCVEKLIRKGAQVNCTDKTGQTAWTLAAHAGSVDVLKCLIEDNGIDKNSTEEEGLSILYWAVGSKDIEAVRYLLKQGVTMTSFVPQECVEACRKCGENIACHYLDAAQLKTDPYVLAIRFCRRDIVRLMDEYGCELYKSAEILSLAICANSVEVVKYLLCNYKYPLNYGYAEKFNDSRQNSDHQTFLIKACKTQSVEMVKLLLKHGADPNIKYCEEKCPSVINVAIYTGHVEVIACFIRGRVTMNTRSYYPNGVVLPFEAAVYMNHIYAAEMLLVAGCSRGIHSWNNNSTLKGNI